MKFDPAITTFFENIDLIKKKLFFFQLQTAILNRKRLISILKRLNQKAEVLWVISFF